MLQKVEKQRRLFDMTFTEMIFLIILQALFLRRGNTRNVARRRKPTNDKNGKLRRGFTRIRIF